MTALDLFSCIGCHALGFERAGIRTMALCEVDEWRRGELTRRFPGVPIFHDVRRISAIPFDVSIDVVVGGPPCQRTSVAAAIHGRRDGASLWPEMLRVVGLAQPRWVVVEQPPGNAAWEAEVAGDLRGAGFHVSRVEFGACDLGAPYPRRRVYLIASPSLSRLEVARTAIPPALVRVARAADARGDWDPDQLGALRVDARSAGEMDGGELSRLRRKRIEALGDSNPPHMAEVIGRAIMVADAA